MHDGLREVAEAQVVVAGAPEHREGCRHLHVGGVGARWHRRAADPELVGDSPRAGTVGDRGIRSARTCAGASTHLLASRASEHLAASKPDRSQADADRRPAAFDRRERPSSGGRTPACGPPAGTRYTDRQGCGDGLDLPAGTGAA